MQLEDQLALQRQSANNARDLLLVLLIIVVLLTLALGMGGMLGDMRDNASKALRDAGFPPHLVTVTNEGRQVTVHGELSSSTEAMHALNTVAKVEGVQEVDNQIVLNSGLPALTLKLEQPAPAEGSGDDAESPAQAEESSEESQAVAAAGETVTGGVSDESSAPKPDIFEQAPRVIASVDSGNIFLDGVLKDTDVMALLLDKVDDNYAPDAIYNRILVDHSIGESTWVNQVGPMLAELKNHPGVEVGFSDLGITLIGEGPAELWDKIAELKEQGAGGGTVVSSDNSTEVAKPAAGVAPVAETATVTAGDWKAPAEQAPAPVSGLADASSAAAASPTEEAPSSSESATSKPATDLAREDIAQLNHLFAYQLRFRSGKTQLEDSAFPLLQDAAVILRRHIGTRIGVGVHTDSRGTPMSNLSLTQGRAEQIKEVLASYGIPEADILATGFGDRSPVASNATPQGRALNRRVQFYLP
ncbi:MAG: OmpA family protein [Gammaproteobacteria bacterium]